MDAHTDWEALPPRKDRKVSAAQPSVRPTVAGYDQIMNNIEERRQRNQSVTTLASKDGCRGRFYECKRKVVVLISCTALTAFSAADLDHTADVQCHAWGDSMKHAFENMAQCMVNYMTDISLIHEDPREQITITVAGTPALLQTISNLWRVTLVVLLYVAGHDIKSLLYNYMNELLFKFSSDSFVTARVEITHFDIAAHSLSATL
jgi:SHS2 domain-containing protein